MIAGLEWIGPVATTKHDQRTLNRAASLRLAVSPLARRLRELARDRREAAQRVDTRANRRPMIPDVWDLSAAWSSAPLDAECLQVELRTDLLRALDREAGAKLHGSRAKQRARAAKGIIDTATTHQSVRASVRYVLLGIDMPHVNRAATWAAAHALRTVIKRRGFDWILLLLDGLLVPRAMAAAARFRGEL